VILSTPKYDVVNDIKGLGKRENYITTGGCEQWQLLQIDLNTGSSRD
jgi:hypothetical protein